MDGGSVAADWRDSRILIRVSIPGALPFVDIAASDTLQALHADPRVAGWLRSFGVADVDLATVISSDRRVTRFLSQLLAEAIEDDHPCYGGIRYASRLGAEHECWAVFESTTFEEFERRPILTTDPDLEAIAEQFNIRVF